jgi:hypothetical protein
VVLRAAVAEDLDAASVPLPSASDSDLPISGATRSPPGNIGLGGSPLSSGFQGRRRREKVIRRQ